jgi:hypothetical protein
MIGMGAEACTIRRAEAANFFFDCRAVEIPSDECVRDNLGIAGVRPELQFAYKQGLVPMLAAVSQSRAVLLEAELLYLENHADTTLHVPVGITGGRKWREPDECFKASARPNLSDCH